MQFASLNLKLMYDDSCDEVVILLRYDNKTVVKSCYIIYFICHCHKFAVTNNIFYFSD